MSIRRRDRCVICLVSCSMFDLALDRLPRWPLTSRGSPSAESVTLSEIGVRASRLLSPWPSPPQLCAARVDRGRWRVAAQVPPALDQVFRPIFRLHATRRSEEHTSELQSH